MRRALAALAVLAAAAAAQDRIILTTGSTIPVSDAQRIRVEKESYAEVVYYFPELRQKVTQKVAADKVASVEYGSTPADYIEAEEAMRAGDYERAIELYQGLAGGTGWTVQYALYRIAQAFRAQLQIGEAVKAYEALLAKVPDTKFLGQALLDVGMCRYLDPSVKDPKAKAAAGREAFLEAKRQVAEKGLPQEWGLRADLMLVRMDQLEGKYDAAIAAYERIVEQARAGAPRVANEARLWIGESMVLKKEFQKARDYFKSILASAPKGEVELRAGALAGLGQCDLEQEKFPDARRYFLWVVTLWDQGEVAGDQKISTEIAGRAFYGAGLSFDILARVSKEELPAANRARARRMLEEGASERFSGTEWGGRCRQKLETLQ